MKASASFVLSSVLLVLGCGKGADGAGGATFLPPGSSLDGGRPSGDGDTSQTTDPSTGDGDTSGGDPAHPVPGDAGVPHGGDHDACVGSSCGLEQPPLVDAGDTAFAGPSKCSSGVMWLLGNVKTELMRPGLACNDCHRTMLVKTFSVAGTVYATGHEPDDCSGAGSFGADTKIEIKDASGQVVSLAPNLSGNFLSEAKLQFPITARVTAGGKERVMVGEIDEAGGDCNTCHTENGTQDAPGRIALP